MSGRDMQWERGVRATVVADGDTSGLEGVVIVEGSTGPRCLSGGCQKGGRGRWVDESWRCVWCRRVASGRLPFGNVFSIVPDGWMGSYAHVASCRYDQHFHRDILAFNVNHLLFHHTVA